jgi:glycosyltransferase involved in cell wall biosynthesis
LHGHLKKTQGTMKISLVTPVFNNVSEVEETLLSVFSQNYGNLEYIVIDGGSTDGTLDILKKYSKQISILVSEKDLGLYHALQKGFDRSSGDILGLLHSGDIFSSRGILKKIGHRFQKNNPDILYGDLVYIQKEKPSKIVRRWKSSFPKKLSLGWMPPHPTIFLKKGIYKKIGPFDTQFKISADYDFILRAFQNNRYKIEYLPEILIKMRTGGKSNNSIKTFIEKTKEDWSIIRKNNAGHLHTLVLKKLSKLSQFL